MRLVRFFLSPSGWGRGLVVLLLCCVSWQLEAIDLNRASSQELQQLKGIGPKTAERIIEERSRAGPYSSLQDLSDRVKGIGPKRLQGLQAAGLRVGTIPSIYGETRTKK